MVLGQITVLADAVGVLRPVKVWTSVSGFLATMCVVTVLAHTLRIEDTINM